MNQTTKLEQPKEYLGFKDLPWMLIGIPVLSFIIPIAFFRENWTNNESHSILENVLATMAYCSFFWIGNRSFIIYIRKRFYGFPHTRKRILLEVFFLILYGIFGTIFVAVSLEFLVGLERGDNLIEGFMATFFTSSFVVAVYEGFYLYYQNERTIMERESFKRAQIKSELEGLRNQVNPHFLFNSMNTLMYIINEDQKLATSFLEKLSHVYRYILEKREEQIISLNEELAFIESYVFLQKERFKNNLEVKITISDYFLNRMIVPLSLQILFENSIKHNVISSSKPLLIEVYILEEEYLVVKNNYQLKKQQIPSTGVGLKNIESRIKYFSEKKMIIEKTENHFFVKIPLLSR